MRGYSELQSSYSTDMEEYEDLVDNEEEDGEEDGEEDEEEDEEDDEEEDDSQLHALIDDLELRFRILVSTKIGEAEQFFDDASTFEIPESPTNFRACSGSTQEKVSPEETDVSPPEQARLEIGELRCVRESLIIQRQQWAAQLKQEVDKSEEEAKLVECKVYEIEEAIEAVDIAIEFKNEVVLGQSVSSSVANVPLGSNEVELVTRLETLSIEELRRLLCKYFGKVVELRSSSRRLEKQLEQTEKRNDRLERKLTLEKRYMTEIRSQYDARIRLILRSHNAGSGVSESFLDMDARLHQAYKKQHDLEKSLTELLVRHGYLVNGADYDVKQVVKMLGIGDKRAGGVTTRPATPAYHVGHRRNGRQLDGHELSRIYRDRDQPRHRSHQAPPAPEVRREKKKLIIQSSNSGGDRHHPRGQK